MFSPLRPNPTANLRLLKALCAAAHHPVSFHTLWARKQMPQGAREPLNMTRADQLTAAPLYLARATRLQRQRPYAKVR